MNGDRHRDVHDDHDGYNLPNYMLANDGRNNDFHRLAEGNNSALRHNYADNHGTLGNTKSGNSVDGWRKRLIGLTQ